VAKLASRAAKPQADRRGVRPGVGVFVVDPGTELDFLHPMPVGALWGVGPATAGRLDELGIRTVGDLAALPEDLLVRQLGRSHGTHLALLARGVDPSPVVANRPTKSLGHEETFAADVHDPDVLAGHALRMAEAVAGQLRRAGLAGRTVSVKVRYADFATVTRSHTLGFVVDTAPALAAMAGALLEALDFRQGIRLLGVSVSGFDEPAPAEQLRFALAAEPPAPSSDRDDGAPPVGASAAATADAAERADVLQSQWRAVSAVLDTIRERYGRSSVGPASGISADGLAVPGPGDRRWGPSAADS
jgi:DNA polymerase IV